MLEPGLELGQIQVFVASIGAQRDRAGHSSDGTVPGTPCHDQAVDLQNDMETFGFRPPYVVCVAIQ